ncbi:hypothetical protein ACF0H5_004752 [Mactra antiquata]
MADTKVTTGQSTLKTPPIPNIEAPYQNERVWQYRERIMQAQINRGSRYPPFSIQPMPWERMRVSKTMTAEEIFLRKQWLADQKLVNEPVYVKEAFFKSAPRRLLGMPMDMAAFAVYRVTGNENVTRYFRRVIPKMAAGWLALVLAFYHVKYNPRTWESINGAEVYTSNRANYETLKPTTEPRFADYYFTDRKVNPATSAPQ